LLVSNKPVPYWSDDLLEYIFDKNYRRTSSCVQSKKKKLGATQQQTNTKTITSCPSTLTNRGVDGLGSATPKARLLVMKVLPRSATLYHELLHLLLSHDETPDTACNS
jgi:hypothetical protein